MRYANLATLEDGYGINLLPLATFAMDTYADGKNIFSLLLVLLRHCKCLIRR